MRTAKWMCWLKTQFPSLSTGKIKIQDILACSFLDDLLEVKIS